MQNRIIKCKDECTQKLFLNTIKQISLLSRKASGSFVLEII